MGTPALMDTSLAFLNLSPVLRQGYINLVCGGERKVRVEITWVLADEARGMAASFMERRDTAGGGGQGEGSSFGDYFCSSSRQRCPEGQLDVQVLNSRESFSTRHWRLLEWDEN